MSTCCPHTTPSDRPTPSPQGPPPTRAERSERNAAALVHLAALSVLVGIPFGNLLGPLVVWLARRDDSELVDRHGRAALDFQITLSLALGGLFVVGIALAAQRGPLVMALVIPLAVVLSVLGAVLTVVATARARSGRPYRYPLSLPWV